LRYPRKGVESLWLRVEFLKANDLAMQMNSPRACGKPMMSIAHAQSLNCLRLSPSAAADSGSHPSTICHSFSIKR